MNLHKHTSITKNLSINRQAGRRVYGYVWDLKSQNRYLSSIKYSKMYSVGYSMCELRIITTSNNFWCQPLYIYITYIIKKKSIRVFRNDFFYPTLHIHYPTFTINHIYYGQLKKK